MYGAGMPEIQSSSSGRVWLPMPTRAFEEMAVLEAGCGADQGDEVGCGDRAPVGLGGLGELEHPTSIRSPRCSCSAADAVARIWPASSW